MSCPLCAHTQLSKSWLSTEFVRKFDYYECRNCHSLVCRPMPDEGILLQMYSDSYFEGEPHDFGQVLKVLEALPKGVFLDYGCGTGDCANQVYRSGWRVVAMEYNPATVKQLQAKYPFEVVQVGCEPSRKADVVHLADVLEHLTDLENQMPEILNLLKPGGLIIAHNPLEGNRNLFQRVVKLGHKLKGSRNTVPPYHVTMATTKGQKEFFKRFGLTELSFDVEQICFPAPYHLREVGTLREAALFFLRRMSQMVSSKDNGNRYFYVGRKG